MKYDFDEIIDRRNTNAQNVEGWRPYIFKCGPDKKFPFADDEFIRMWVADMEFAVAPEIRQAIKDRVDRKILGYTGIFGTEYYNAFRRWCLERYAWEFPQEELAFSPGVIPALYQLVEDIVKPAGGKVLTLSPSYGHFLHACTYNNVELVCSPLRLTEAGFEIDFADLAAKAKDPAVKMLIFCNPHNPTGRMWSQQELEKVAAIVRENGLWVVSDEIHCDLLRCGNRHIPLAKVMADYPFIATCMSASKTFNLAGLCFSNVIIRNADERRRFRKRLKTGGDVNPLSLAAHQAAYEQGGDWLEELKIYLDDNLKLVRNFLDVNIPSAGFHIPEATYFAWIDLRKTLPDAGDLPLYFANKAGVLLEGGNSLFVDNAEGFVRLNLAMPRVLIAEALNRIGGAI